ncbi:MAG: hypothetical protein JW797_09565 [Bradymonadales bacterium]|nr:hypothetical protein [Bradymonadales bacterium]
MNRLISLFVVALLPFTLCQACMYNVISTRTEPRMSDVHVVDTQIDYRVASQSLIGDSLVINLSRSCLETREGMQETVLVETRQYNYTGAWVTMAGVAGASLTVALVLYLIGQDEIDMAEPFFEDEQWDEQKREDGERMQATAGWVALTTLVGLAVGTVVLLTMGGDDIRESETLVSRNPVREGPVQSSCTALWPSGMGTLFAPAIGRQFEAFANGTERIEIDLAVAPVQIWESADSLMLELPGVSQWIPFELDRSVRTVGITRYSQAQHVLNLTFDDTGGDNDGQLDPGEIAAVVYEVINNSEGPLTNLSLDLDAGEVSGVRLESPVYLGDLAAGQVARGRVDLITSSDLRQMSAMIEGRLHSGSGIAQCSRLNIPIQAQTGPQRAHIWYDEGSRYRDLLATGAVRIQTVLTETGQHAFVADPATRERINAMVAMGGGSPEDRLRSALQAANQENIRKVFQLSVNPVAGNHIQIVLSVYETASSDRVFLRDAAVDSTDALQVLDAFDGLGRAYLSWSSR